MNLWICIRMFIFSFHNFLLKFFILVKKYFKLTALFLLSYHKYYFLKQFFYVLQIIESYPPLDSCIILSLIKMSQSYFNKHWKPFHCIFNPILKFALNFIAFLTLSNVVEKSLTLVCLCVVYSCSTFCKLRLSFDRFKITMTCSPLKMWYVAFIIH